MQKNFRGLYPGPPLKTGKGRGRGEKGRVRREKAEKRGEIGPPKIPDRSPPLHRTNEIAVYLTLQIPNLVIS